MQTLTLQEKLKNIKCANFALGNPFLYEFPAYMIKNTDGTCYTTICLSSPFTIQDLQIISEWLFQNNIAFIHASLFKNLLTPKKIDELNRHIDSHSQENPRAFDRNLLQSRLLNHTTLYIDDFCEEAKTYIRFINIALSHNYNELKKKYFPNGTKIFYIPDNKLKIEEIVAMIEAADVNLLLNPEQIYQNFHAQLPDEDKLLIETIMKKLEQIAQSHLVTPKQCMTIIDFLNSHNLDQFEKGNTAYIKGNFEQARISLRLAEELENKRKKVSIAVLNMELQAEISQLKAIKAQKVTDLKARAQVKFQNRNDDAAIFIIDEKRQICFEYNERKNEVNLKYTEKVQKVTASFNHAETLLAIINKKIATGREVKLNFIEEKHKTENKYAECILEKPDSSMVIRQKNNPLFRLDGITFRLFKASVDRSEEQPATVYNNLLNRFRSHFSKH